MLVDRILKGALCAAMALAAATAFAGKADDTLNAAFIREVTTLDNYRETSREGLILGRLIYDSLLSKDPVTGKFRGELASSYRQVDPTTLEFVIRKGVKFHNGEILTADDVVYTLNRVSSKSYNARYQIAVTWIDKVEKVGEDRVRIRMKEVFPLALEMLAGNLPIYPRAYYEAVGPEGMGTKPVGSGPYRVVEVVQGAKYVLERFDDYYRDSPKGRPAIKRLVVRVLPEANTQYAELLNGRLDWIWRVPPDEAASLASRPNVIIQNTSILRFAYISINSGVLGEKTPLADARVRQAISHAINKPGIVRSLVGGASRPIESACNPRQFGCETAVQQYPYDPAKAKQLLAAAGYPNGFAIDMVVSSVPRSQAEVIASMLSKVGITLKINMQQSAASTSAWRAGKAPLRMADWGSYGIADAGLSTGQFFNGSADDLSRDPEVVDAVKRADATDSRETREKLYSSLLKRIANQAYMVPLWTYSVTTAQSKELNFTLDADEYASFFRATWR